MSTQEVAEAINAYLYRQYKMMTSVDHRFVSNYEAGAHHWPTKYYREAFRVVLEVATDAELGFYPNRKRRVVTPTAPISASESAERALAFVGSGAGAPDDRRRVLLFGIAIVTAASGLLGGTGWAKTRRLGPTDVARLNAVTALYRSMDYEFGGGALVADVGRSAESASSLLDLSYSDALAPSLFTSIAAARQLAGWTAFDSGRHSDGQRHFLAAERAAVAADDVLLAARVRYCQARQLQHLHHNRDAINTLRLARDHLGAAATPAVMAMIYGAEAASQTALGDMDSALDVLGRARDEFGRVKVDHEPEWMRFYDEGELLAQYGRVYRDLARADHQRGNEAVRWVTAAIDAFGPQNVRSAVLNEVGLCSALFLADEPEQALVVSRRVQAQAKQLSSQRVIDRLANLRRDLCDHRSLPEVTEFARSLPMPGSDTA